MNTFHTDVTVSTGNLFKLERCGRYEEALAELRHIWEDTNSFPVVDNFPTDQAAEIILRCGALIGFSGHRQSLPDSQETSKNLLTEARGRFFDLGDIEKIAECENYLALAYWRTGELREAEAFISEALLHDLPESNQVRLYSLIIQCLIFFQLQKVDENLLSLRKAEGDFLKFGSDCLKGDFYSHYGLALRKIGKIDQALEKYKLAKHFFRRAHHLIYLAIVENNLTYIHKSNGNFGEAHQAIDNSVKIFKQLKDRTREGFSLDTKANIFCDEGKYSEALKVIEKAIRVLSKCENADYLAETYLSKAKIFLYLDNFTAGFMSLSDAVQIAKTRIGEEKAVKLVEEFERTLKEKSTPVVNTMIARTETANEKLELVLHPTIAHYHEFQGIWINNTNLESFGLQKGALALAAKAEIKRGDLVAINEIATNSIVCGFYDSDFGLICLESIGTEPKLYNEDEIQILGKIVGVGKREKPAGGKIAIEPLSF